MTDTELLTRVKRALDISANIYDAELTSLITDAKRDLSFGNFDMSIEADDTIARAIALFCSWQFQIAHGDLTRASALEKAYNSIKTQIGTSGAYTDWGDSNEQQS